MPGEAISSTSKKTSNKPACNCELCSATVRKSNTPWKPSIRPAPSKPGEVCDDIPCIRPKFRTSLSRCKTARTNSEFHEGCVPESAFEPECEPVIEEMEDPCRRKPKNIIRRNKLAVKILSRQVRAEKMVAPPCDPRYEKVKLFPTAHHAIPWAPAYSLARNSTFIPRKPAKKAKKKPAPPPPKKPTVEEILNDTTTNCSCELLAHAIRPDLHHHMGLSDQRDKINAGPLDSPPSL